MFAPFGDIVNEDPEQMVPLFTVTVGKGFTVTNDIAFLLQAPVIPVTVYVLVVDILDVTTLPVVALKPIGGVQL